MTFAPKTLLIVEDNALIALDAEFAAIDLGCQVAGKAAKISDALEILATKSIDAAIIDYELLDGTSEPVANALTRRNIPFVVVSAMSRDFMLSRGFSPAQLASKPADFTSVITDHLLMQDTRVSALA